MITFLTVTPANAALISEFSVASFSNSSLLTLGETSMRSLILPFTCKIAITLSAPSNDLSTTGQPALAIADIELAVESFRFNVVIARIMELVNATRKVIDSGAGPSDAAVREAAEAIAISLSLVAPYTAEEMWEYLGHKPAIANAGWPVVDKSLLGADNVIAILQVNGKIKDRIEVSPNISQDELEKLATDNSQIKAALMGMQVKKVITVTPKLVNFVI